jgi:hypothetical protein
VKAIHDGGFAPKPPLRAVVLVPALVLLVAAATCQDRLAHVFGGWAYDTAGDCLDAPGVVDVVDGPDPGKCPQLRCWLAPDGTAYVTDEACDAPIDFQDQTKATSGVCVKALAAYHRTGHGLCPTPADAGAGGSIF